MPDFDPENLVNAAVQKERRLVTVEMEVKAIKESMRQGFQDMRNSIKLSLTVFGLVIAAIEAIARMVHP